MRLGGPAHRQNLHSKGASLQQGLRCNNGCQRLHQDNVASRSLVQGCKAQQSMQKLLHRPLPIKMEYHVTSGAAMPFEAASCICQHIQGTITKRATGNFDSCARRALQHSMRDLGCSFNQQLSRRTSTVLLELGHRLLWQAVLGITS